MGRYRPIWKTRSRYSADISLVSWIIGALRSCMAFLSTLKTHKNPGATRPKSRALLGRTTPITGKLTLTVGPPGWLRRPVGLPEVSTFSPLAIRPGLCFVPGCHKNICQGSSFSGGAGVTLLYPYLKIWRDHSKELFQNKYLSNPLFSVVLGLHPFLIYVFQSYVQFLWGLIFSHLCCPKL